MTIVVERSSVGGMSVEMLSLNVPGMTCGHCESAIRKEVGAISGVTSIDVNLETKIVVVNGDNLDREAVVAAIDEAGFDVG